MGKVQGNHKTDTALRPEETKRQLLPETREQGVWSIPPDRGYDFYPPRPISRVGGRGINPQPDPSISSDLLLMLPLAKPNQDLEGKGALDAVQTGQVPGAENKMNNGENEIWRGKYKTVHQVITSRF